jgi:hypothetical protein
VAVAPVADALFLEMPVPEVPVVFAVFAVAAAADVVPVMPSELVGQIPVSDRSPRPAVVRRAEPSAIAIDEVVVVKPDEVVVPSPRDGKAVIVEVHEIGVALGYENRSATDVDTQIDFSLCIVLG